MELAEKDVLWRKKLAMGASPQHRALEGARLSGGVLLALVHR